MNTVGLLVQCRPQLMAALQPQIINLGCEVHLANAEGKFVLTLEAEFDSQITETLTALQNLSGVLNASLVYHHYNDSEEELPA